MYKTHVFILSLLLTVLQVFATTRYVVTPGTPGTPGSGYTSWETAATNIQDAINAADPDDLILVTNGTYFLTSQITITNKITLKSYKDGVTDRAGTILDAQYPAYTNRCLLIDNVAAVVEGFTFTNGYAAIEGDFVEKPGNGGAIYVHNQGSITDSIISGNQSAGHGGGVFFYNGGTLAGCAVIGNSTLTNNEAFGGGICVEVWHKPGLVTNCLIKGNVSRKGGGAYIWNDHPSQEGFTVVDCDVIENTAYGFSGGDGGAGLALHRRAFVIDCRVISNRVEKVTESPAGSGIQGHQGVLFSGCYIAYNSGATYGGGIGDISAGSIVTNCVIVTNSANYGGGVFVQKTGLIVDSFLIGNTPNVFAYGGTFRNCLITGGGKIWVFQTSGVTFQNCTIYGNSLGFDFKQPCVVENCIVYGNTQNWVLSGAGTNTVWTNSCTYPLPTGPYDIGNIDADPRWVDADNEDFRLRESSPCIDTGIDRPWMASAWDLGGAQRIIGAVAHNGSSGRRWIWGLSRHRCHEELC